MTKLLWDITGEEVTRELLHIQEWLLMLPNVEDTPRKIGWRSEGWCPRVARRLGP